MSLWSNEHNNHCPSCKSPTALMTTGALEWACDDEPFSNGEPIETIKDPILKGQAERLSQGIELGEEITLHVCPNCHKITSVCVNW